MCGGGDGGPEPPDPMKEAEAQIRQLQAQYDLDQKAALAAAEREKAKEKAARSQWQTDLGASRSRAGKSISELFKGKGLDPGDYESRINAALDLEQGGKSFGGSTGFSSDIGENLLGDIRNERVRGYQGDVNKFAPTGFEDQRFGSTADDAVIDAILGEQYGTASDAVMRARDRGNLNDVGFKYAMSNLDTQKKAAGSRLQDTGGGILSGYRTQLGDIVKNARTAAGNWDFGDTFDPNAWSKQLQSRTTDLSGRLEGDIRNAIGGEQFFNIDDLIAKGGIGQGAINTGMGAQSGSLLAAIRDRQKQEEQARGLGTQGSF